MITGQIEYAMSRKLPILLALLAFAAPAAAQILTSPQDVTRCLCADRAVKMLAEEVAARKRMYDDVQQQVHSLDLDLDRRRQTMNVNDEAQVQAYRDRFDQRSGLSARLAGEIGADYRTAVERYNRAVAQYNDGCVGRILDSGVVAAVTPTLVCPTP
jgi:TolA-binding protein